MAKDDERRKHRRITVRAPVTVRIVPRMGRWFLWMQPRIKGVTRDISAGGLQVQVEVAAPLPAGASVELRTPVDDGERMHAITLYGRVLRSHTTRNNASVAAVRLSDGPRHAMAAWQHLVFDAIRRRDG